MHYIPYLFESFHQIIVVKSDGAFLNDIFQRDADALQASLLSLTTLAFGLLVSFVWRFGFRSGLFLLFQIKAVIIILSA
jgi:hypothetical protein